MFSRSAIGGLLLWAFLSLVGPVIGTAVTLALLPLLIFGLLLGWKFWLIAYLFGGVPSVLTSGTIVCFQLRNASKIKLYLSIAFVSAVSTLGWLLILDYGNTEKVKPSPYLFSPVLMAPGVVAGLLLCFMANKLVARFLLFAL